jgi:hypothetical protein
MSLRVGTDNGGEAPISEVAEIVGRLFRNHRNYGERIMEQLTPICARQSETDVTADKCLLLLCVKA